MCDNNVYCIIPSFNRLNELRNCIKQLNKQTFRNIKIVIVNDGSTDGTLEYLQDIEDDNFHFINGDGNLWWGKSINEGLKYVLDRAKNQDFILLLNDDTYFDENFVQYFLNDHGDLERKIILGAYQADIDTKERTILGYKINFLKTRINDNLICNGSETIDALPGRGLFFSFQTFKQIGLINTKFFRQAMGDLEYTSRAKEKGINLKICENAIVYTKSKSPDDTQIAQSFFKRLTSRFHNNSILLTFTFFCIRGPLFLRLWCLPRFIFFRIFR